MTRSPVLILQHLSADGPAYLGTWLARIAVNYSARAQRYRDTLVKVG